MATCELCKHDLMEGARFCSFCGAIAKGASRKEDFELGKLAAIEEIQKALMQRLRTLAVYFGIPFVVASWFGLDALLQNKAEQLINVELRTDLRALSQHAEKAIGRLDLITTDLVAARIQYQFALAEAFALLHESVISFAETLQRVEDFIGRDRRQGPSNAATDSGESMVDPSVNVRLAALDLVYTYGDFLLGLMTGEGPESTQAFLTRFTTQSNNLKGTKYVTWIPPQLLDSLSTLRNQEAAAPVIEPASKVTANILKTLEADAEAGNNLYNTLSNYTVAMLTSDVVSTTKVLITHVSRYSEPDKSFSNSAQHLENNLNNLIAGIVTEAPLSFQYSKRADKPRFSPTQGAPEVKVYLKLIQSDVSARRAYVSSEEKYRMAMEAYKTTIRAVAGTYQKLAQVTARHPGKDPSKRGETEQHLPSPAVQTKVLRELASELSTASFQLRRAQANYRTATQGLLSQR